MKILNPKFCFLSVFVLIICHSIVGQEQLEHKMKWYIDDNGKFYTNKNLPVYIRLSHSPEEGAPSHLLKSKSLPQYTNPMYFDSEGYNSFRSPSAVDTVTKRIVRPKREIRFEVYADGNAPKSTIKFSDAKKYIGKSRKVIYGPSLKINLKARDVMSGIDKIYYSINGGKYEEYKGELSMNKEGDFTIKYYSLDNVGNVEKVKQTEFSVDLSPPVTMHNIQGEVFGGVVSPRAKVFLSAEDNMSGVSSIMYSLNDAAPKLYTNPIPLSHLQGGKSRLKFFSVDNVGNSGNENLENKGVNLNNENADIRHGSSEYVINIDRSGPGSSAKIIGDQYQANHLFISERSKIQIDAKDDNTQVEKISYSINSKVKDKKYTQPISFNLKADGIYYVNFSAVDKLGNVGKNGAIVVRLDSKAPTSNISFDNPKFLYNNSLIISTATNIKISSVDLGSNINKIEHLIDNNGFVEGADFQINDEGKHSVSYRAIDNVNNVEQAKSTSVTVDNSPPQIFAVHSIDSSGTKIINDKSYPVYPTRVGLFLAATDEISGLSKFTYSINGSEEIDYMQNSFIFNNNSFVKEGLYSVKVVVVDKLGNQAEKIIEFYASNNS